MSPDRSGDIEILAVDLDGTLLRSDMLYETFWSAWGRDWRIPVTAARALRDGRPNLKRHLGAQARVDVTTLPYDPAVLARLRAWRETGGRTALVTASDQGLADAIADHLGLFDEVHGSDGQRNLKGQAKADFLVERFGAGRFAYMGDAEADLPVWSKSALALTANASPELRRKAAASAPQVEHLGQPITIGRAHLKALRPHQWLKNLLVFLPMLAAHQFTIGTFLQSLMAFIVFSLIASSVYVLNDLLDLRADRAHPRKSARPFAAGNVPIAHGTWMAGGLIGVGVLVSLLLGRDFFLAMVAYFAITTAYSLSLKRRVVVDICTLAGLYTMRIIAGGAATGIPLSIWLLAFSVFFFFSLAGVKRHAELVDNLAQGKLKPTGRGYHVDDLPTISMMVIGAGYVSVLVFALYMNSPDVVQLYSSPLLLGGICAVLLYWISRIAMLTARGHMHDDPVVFAVRDRNSRVCLLLIVGFTLAGALL